MTRVVHVTSVHPRTDTRILKKELRSLGKFGYEVFLVVADGLGDDCISGVEIRDVGHVRRRLLRILFAPWLVFFRANRLKADVYHLHDPELMIIGMLLRLFGRKVIFDAHESFRKQLLSKAYLRPIPAKLMSYGIAVMEFISFKTFNHIIAATPSIQADINYISDKKITTVNNFPRLEEFDFSNSMELGSVNAVYLGAITRIRGVAELITALPLCDSFYLDLIGPCDDSEFLGELKKLEGWSRVRYHGALPSREAFQIVSRSLVGVVTYLPYPNHIQSQPNKLFEYMAAGIPVIASDFPLWKEIVVVNEAGLCVAPESPIAIADAFRTLLGNQEKLDLMGRNGRAAVQRTYNWDQQEEILLEVYKKVLDKS